MYMYIYIHIYIYIYEIIFFFQKVLGLLKFGSCQNSMSPTNLVAEIQLKLSNERALSTGEPCTCEYITLLQSFHGSTISVPAYIVQNDYPTFSMTALFRRSFKTDMTLKV